MKILMGTANQGKIEGARQAFEKYFNQVQIEGISVNSNVNNQPLNKEVFQGAKNRVKNLKEYAKKNNIQADFYIASEGGIQNLLCAEWIEFNAAVIEDNKELTSVGTSQGFPIPNRYMDEIRKTELGIVMDRIFKENELNIGQGGVSLLTHGELTRIELTKNAFIMALTKYINGDIWK